MTEKKKKNGPCLLSAASFAEKYMLALQLFFKPWRVNWTPGSGNSGGARALQKQQGKPPLPDAP